MLSSGSGSVMHMRSERSISNEIEVGLFVSFRRWMGVRESLVATAWCTWASRQWPGDWN